MIQNLSADDYLIVADGLSPAPRILPRLLVLLADPDNDISQMVDLICFDPGLTSKLLRACNSAFVGLPEPASDVGEAINRLGVAFVYQLVAAVCGSSTYQSSCRNDLAQQLWQHSVTSAFAAEMLATDVGLDGGSLFTAALLHDIGKMVLAEKWKEDYWGMVENTRFAPAQLVEREQSRFNLNHGELGGRVLAHWKFPSLIATSVWQHAAPGPGIPFERETACVTLAEVIADTVNAGDSAPAPPPTSGPQNALALLGLTPADLNGYVSRTQENFQFVNAMCQMSA